MKKNATRYCAGSAYYRMCSTDVYCSKQTGKAVAPKETTAHHFFVSENWAEENCRCSQNLQAQKNVVKTETQQTFVNGLPGFITLGISNSPEARVLLTILHELPIDMGNSSALLINILLGSFQLFLHSDQPLSEGEIILFSGVCQSGRLHYPRRRRWWLHALTDRLL